MYVIPDKTLCKRLSPGSKSRILFQSTVLLVSLGLWGVAIFLLARGIMRRQRWTGESDFCSFIAFASAAKWFYFIGYRVHKARVAPDTAEDEVAEEKLNLFEDSPSDWSPEQKKMIV
ncbi:uncharacterized protein Tco025E_03384 [Trypanosoma conorhini]|uniref:Uncharacterized protein n=1 Tax=Trypanosoma conorhini TaxID=83891 RepID=A0A3S5ITL5_9TRYP|nr:uncharacterized protein Tco025E_03384 [Trypanosoma conorhini]RNF22017.1 hypothetical protein Tco025E_03384 [Trypanosoma conorhini]